MCNPALAVLAVTVVASGVTYYGQEEQAKSQQKFAKAQAKEGQRIARENFDLQNEAESERLAQQNEADAQQALEIQRAYAQQRATAKVAAGESGIEGNAVNELIMEFNQHEGEELSTIKRNAEFGALQSSFNRRGFQAQANQNIGRTQYAPIGRGNKAQLAAGIASGVTNYGTSMGRAS